MKKERLNLNHRPLLQKGLSELSYKLSDYSFATLYLFRDSHNYELCISDVLTIEGTTYDGVRFLMPTSFASLQYLAKLDHIAPGIDCVFPIDEDWLQFFDPSLWQRAYNEDDSDYLFPIEQMATYAGRHLSKKRNLVHQLEEHYQVSIRPFEKAVAKEILKKWREGVQNSGDEASCLEAIEQFEALQLHGTIFYCDEEPAGFLIGEPLSSITYNVHFAKGNVLFKGIYQYMFQALCKTLQGKYTLFNMEQDLGSEDLRHAKHSYHPISMGHKFRLKRR